MTEGLSTGQPKFDKKKIEEKRMKFEREVWYGNFGNDEMKPTPEQIELKKKRKERKLEIIEEKKAKQKRKNFKLKTEGLILELIERKVNTFYKIKNCLKENYYPHKENEIRNALSRLLSKNKVIKVTKRIYAPNFK